jgi:hypothetical protein
MMYINVHGVMSTIGMSVAVGLTSLGTVVFVAFCRVLQF